MHQKLGVFIKRKLIIRVSCYESLRNFHLGNLSINIHVFIS